MERIVIDTNVLVAGLKSRQGGSFALLGKLGGSEFVPLLSPPLCVEYEDVLSRSGMISGFSAVDAGDFVDYMVSSISVQPMSTLTVSLPDSIRHRAEILAKSDGITFDQFVALALAEKVAVLDAGAYLAERAKRGDREKFEAILARVPDVPPVPGDEMPEK